MSKTIKWGIISTANIVRRRFLPAIQKSSKAQVIAIGSRELRRAQDFAQEFNIPRHYGSYQDVINDPDVGAVYIALPNEWHAEWTVKAAQAGKHILCEKPIALDAEQALVMANACKSSGVLLMEAFMYRMNPRTLLIKEIVDSGLIGEPRMISSDFAFMLEPRHTSRLIPGKGSGSLMDIGCYCVNISRYIFGMEPIAVMASSYNHPEIGCDMTMSGVLEFGNNRMAVFNTSFEAAFRSSLQVAGTQGVLRVERPFTPNEEGKTDFTVQTSDGKTHLFEVGAVDQFMVEIDTFSDCIRTGTDVPLNPYTDAVANMRVIDALRLSAATHCRVEAAR